MRPTLKVCALLATTVLASPALAQTPGSLAAPPVRSPVDENGVDVVRLIFSTGQTAVSIGGAGNHGLAYGQSFIGSFTPRDSFVGTLSQSGTVVTAGFGGSSDSFTVSGSSYVSTEGNGATLTHALGFYTYTNRNGVVVRFDDNSNVFYTFWDANLGRISDITYPDGTKVQSQRRQLHADGKLADRDTRLHHRPDDHRCPWSNDELSDQCRRHLQHPPSRLDQR